MSNYIEKVKKLTEPLHTPALFLISSIGSSAVSLWCIWSILEWAHSK